MAKPEDYSVFRGMLNGANFNSVGASNAVVKYIDYFDGRAIKSDLSGDSAYHRMYDRDAGDGVFAKIVANMLIKNRVYYWICFLIIFKLVSNKHIQ